jgi:hypothetical protein
VRVIFITNRKWTSGIVRGHQIADRMGAPCDPPEIDPRETVVAVKCWSPVFPEIERLYCDILDSDSLLPTIQAHPRVGVIVCTETGRDYVAARVENPIVVIPHHHCNFESRVRSARPPTVAGYAGPRGNFDLDPEMVKHALSRIGLSFRWMFTDEVAVSREDLCAFYPGIDIQIVFRKPRLIPNMPPELKNPLKLVNAGSFKVPTVGYPERCCREAGEGFLPARTLEGVVAACDALKTDAAFYDRQAEAGHRQAEAFHIREICRRYRQIDTVPRAERPGRSKTIPETPVRSPGDPKK